METLTKRELEIADLIHQGFFEKEIAERLFVSPQTVHTHKKHIFQKMGARNIADITRMYILDLKRPLAIITMIFSLGLHGIATITNADEMRRPQAMRGVRSLSRTRRKENDYILK
jgi:DNA-binding CsgD family transcriptional regulator